MAITSTYPIIVPKLTDLIVGTQTYTATDPVLNNPTRNFTVQSIADVVVNSLGTANTIAMFSTSGLTNSLITQVIFDASTTAVNVGTVPTKGGGVADDPFWIDNFQVQGTLSVSEKVAIGTPRQLENQGFDLNILGEEGKIAFGDNNIFGDPAIPTPITWNVVVGEYGTGDTDKLQLHGKEGTVFTRGQLGAINSMVIDNSGQVGINIPSPSEKLEVGGNIKASGAIIDSGTGTSANLTLKATASSNGGGGVIDIIGGSSDFVSYKTYVKLSGGTTVASQVYDMAGDGWTWDGNMQTGVNTSTSYNFKSGGSSQMVIYNNNVGIGITNPSAKLHVVGTSLINGNLYFGDNTTTDPNIFNYQDGLHLYAATGNQIDLGGGIGNRQNNVSVGNGTLYVSSGLKLGNILEYADNAAALAAGLVAGQVYRTVDLLKIVH